MGIFSKLLGSSSDIEKQLESIYVPIFQTRTGMSLTQAKSFFRDLIKKAKEESLKEGTSKFPQNFGDIQLEQESTNPHFKSMLARKRNQYVRDEDIRWWWNMHDLERRIIEKIDDNIRMTCFVNNCKEGMSVKEATENVIKFYPIYGDPKDTSKTSGDDRPLPDELRNRVNAYIEKRSKVDPEELSLIHI